MEGNKGKTLNYTNVGNFGGDEKMNLSKGFHLANKYYPLLLVPIILDLLQLGTILRSVQGITLKLTIPSALPSITQVLNTANQGTDTFNINLPYGYLDNVFLIVLIAVLYLLAGAFLKGGFLGCILAGINEQEVSASTYIQTGKQFFGRFLAQALLMLILLLVSAPFWIDLGPLALLLMIGLLILSFYLIFWDYVIVADNAGLIEAAQISLARIQSDLGKVLLFIIPIALITTLIGLAVSALITSSAILAVLAIALYAYFGTVAVFAIMTFYLDISGREAGSNFTYSG
ncbi:hypothetical protein [Desulfitobacterium hafniense]|uniref:hypothetical protein n=1 Tax=Desulfitobacterium hafniense TaxID=49338 RepID=UPI001FA79E5E|nr:hypothetical protein [Desulfitobacterium hafniense]